MRKTNPNPIKNENVGAAKLAATQNKERDLSQRIHIKEKITSKDDK
jgi:hypothetical protein